MEKLEFMKFNKNKDIKIRLLLSDEKFSFYTIHKFMKPSICRNDKVYTSKIFCPICKMERKRKRMQFLKKLFTWR